MITSTKEIMISLCYQDYTRKGGRYDCHHLIRWWQWIGSWCGYTNF